MSNNPASFPLSAERRVCVERRLDEAVVGRLLRWDDRSSISSITSRSGEIGRDGELERDWGGVGSSHVSGPSSVD